MTISPIKTIGTKILFEWREKALSSRSLVDDFYHKVVTWLRNQERLAKLSKRGKQYAQ